MTMTMITLKAMITLTAMFTSMATMSIPIRTITIIPTTTIMRIIVTATTTAMSRAATGSIMAVAWPASMFPA